jgi:bifunctional non-homologous end joining protein LigD
MAQNATSSNSASLAAKPAKLRRASILKPPPFRPVQLATLVDTVPVGNEWIHEIKYDGYRTLVAVGGGAAKAYTRSGLDWSHRFAPLLAAATTLAVGSALIDGEVVVVDEKGRSSFQRLQSALKGDPDAIVFYAFDLLSLDGKYLTGFPLIERKEKLRGILSKGSKLIHYSDHILGSGEQLLNKFCAAALEGVISKGRRTLYRLPQQWLAEDQMHQAAGIRHCRLDTVRQGAWLSFTASRGQRRRETALCRKGRHRFH